MNSHTLTVMGLRSAPARTVLTVGCLAAAFCLAGLLQGVDQSFRNTITTLGKSSDRIFVTSRVSQIDPMPIAHLERIDAIPGVAAAVPGTALLAYYQDPKQQISALAVDPRREFAVFTEYRVSPQQLAAMADNRQGAIVGRKLAQTYGWKIGDRLPLRSHVWARTDGSADWSFELVGTYDAPPGEEDNVFVNYSYFDEGRAFLNGTAHIFVVRAAPSVDPNELSRRIDAQFANSAYETLAQTEKQMVRNNMQRLGDIGMMVKSVTATIFALLLFLVAYTMSQSANERLAEFATLKLMGFTDGYVFALVLGECAVLTLSGAALGLLLAAQLIRMLPEELGRLTLPLQTVGLVVAAAVLVSLLSGLLPALKIRSLSVVAALSR